MITGFLTIPPYSIPNQRHQHRGRNSLHRHRELRQREPKRRTVAVFVRRQRAAGVVDLHVRRATGGGDGVPRRGRGPEADCRVREGVCSAWGIIALSL